MLTRSRRTKSVASALGLLAGFGVVFLAASANKGGAASPTQPGNLEQTAPNLSGACGVSSGTAISLPNVALPYDVLMPNDSLADEKSLKASFQCSTTEIVLQFSSGVRVYEDVNTIKDPSAAWQGMASESADTSVGTVLGQPAALIDPFKGGPANGSVTFVLNGTWIVVEGNGKASLDDLV